MPPHRSVSTLPPIRHLPIWLLLSIFFLSFTAFSLYKVKVFYEGNLSPTAHIFQFLSFCTSHILLSLLFSPHGGSFGFENSVFSQLSVSQFPCVLTIHG